MKTKIDLIAFDADDTLWINESHYRNTEKDFEAILINYLDINSVGDLIYESESQNIELFGYGAKGFTLSMIETAIKITKGKISADDIHKIIQTGKRLMNYDITLLPQTIETLEIIAKSNDLLMITKGDLIDQERKISKSGLSKFFKHIEIISEKDEDTYRSLIDKYNVKAENFLMIGNSLRSDIIPVLNLGGNAIHLTGQSSWIHELSYKPNQAHNYPEIVSLNELIPLFKSKYHIKV